ncbi:hypothetical protein AA11825_2000 [Acetobacter pomorum DSM 11825]|nr:hypothetical protein AA11825_2000 [Acetobacter pomorum DSM 11825]
MTGAAHNAAGEAVPIRHSLVVVALALLCWAVEGSHCSVVEAWERPFVAPDAQTLLQGLVGAVGHAEAVPAVAPIRHSGDCEVVQQEVGRAIPLQPAGEQHAEGNLPEAAVGSHPVAVADIRPVGPEERRELVVQP